MTNSGVDPLDHAPIRAWRFVHGKVCTEPGGPVTPGFEHRPTSISTGLPPPLLPLCRPELLDNQSLQALIHPASQQQGALWFWPAGCEGRRYMLAARVRPRPESGEGGLSRTHTQLATFVFQESDWAQHAPRLLANASRWLRAEPDTLAEYEQFAAAGAAPPPVLTSAQLPERPRCEAGPLPRPGALLWRLTGALELASGNLVVGAADGIRSESAFLTALSCVAALLPAELRIYLTAAAGFATPLDGQRHPFALQYLPEAPALGSAEPGLLEQFARAWLAVAPDLDLAGWQRCWARRQPPNGGATQDADLTQLLSALGHPRWQPGGSVQTADLARTRYAEVCDNTHARRSVTDLRSWLDGRLPAPPARPACHHRATGKQWTRTLTRQLNDGLSRPPGHTHGMARALAQLAALVDSDPAADFWAAAWRAAEADAGGGREVLRWAAVTAAPWPEESGATPQPGAPAPLGWLRDFGELRALFDALARAQAEGPQEAARVATLLKATPVKRRLRALRERAPQLLTLRPEGIIDLAAAWPGLLAPLPGDDPAWATATANSLRALLLASRLYAWAGPPVPPRSAELAAAAAQVADRCGLEEGEAEARRGALLSDYGADLTRLLAHYWRFSLGLNAERDIACTLWFDGVINLLRVVAGAQEPTLLLGHLLDRAEVTWSAAAGPQPDLTKARPAAERLAAAGIDALLPLAQPGTGSGADPAALAATILRALPDPRRLAPSGGNLARETLTAAVNARLRAALAHPQADPRQLADHLLPLLTKACERATAFGVDPATLTPTVIAQTLDLARGLLERLLAAGAPPHKGVNSLLDRLERLVARGGGSEAVVSDAVDALTDTIARCLVAWALAPQPQPWLRGRIPLADAPLRRRLARRLGYPRCVYFGGLTDADDTDLVVRGIRTASLGRVDAPTHHLWTWAGNPAQRAGVGRVLAHGAATCWQGLFAAGSLNSHNLLARLFRESSAEVATDEALSALADLCAAPVPPWPEGLIDPEIWFAVGFFAGLDPPRPPAVPAAPVPPALAAALLSNGSRHAGSLAIHLGRLLATGRSRVAQPFLSLWGDPDSNRRVVERVLRLPGGWDGFLAASDEARRAGLLRLLYLLALIRTENRVGAERKSCASQHIAQAVQLLPAASAATAAVADFLAREPPLGEALVDAARLVGLETLPGWPL